VPIFSLYSSLHSQRTRLSVFGSSPDFSAVVFELYCLSSLSLMEAFCHTLDFSYVN
jgi:hypothetical protein